MTLTTELDPFATALQEAQSELGEGSPSEPPEPQDPEVGTEPEGDEEQADQAPEEQPEEEGPPSDEDIEQSEEPEEGQELFDDLEVDEPPAQQDIEQQLEAYVFELPGVDEPLTLQDLKDGYLRQADYTKKTQALAAERKEQEKASQFWQVFTERPKEVAYQLAIEAGLIEEGAQPIKVVDLPFRSEEDIQAEVDRKVEEALAQHPVVQEAQRAEADRWIESEFSRIEQAYEVKLGPESRRKVLTEAHQRQTTDLELVFQAMLARQQQRKAQTQDLKKAAPKRPTGKASTEANTEPASSFEEAVEMAAAQIASQRR